MTMKEPVLGFWASARQSEADDLLGNRFEDLAKLLAGGGRIEVAVVAGAILERLGGLRIVELEADGVDGNALVTCALASSDRQLR